MNQCQGCMAGWPLVERTSPITQTKSYFHLVSNGYPGEICSCTKHLYEERSMIKIGVWQIYKDETGYWRACHENYDGAPDGNHEYMLCEDDLEELLHRVSAWENG